MKMIFITLFISLFYLIGFYLLKTAIVDYTQSKKALNWPTASAQIIGSELITNYDSEGSNTYTVEVNYQYSVNGISYINDNLAFGYSSSSSKKTQQKILDKLNNAKKIYINYKPEDPQTSVIVPGLNNSTIGTFIFSIVWLFFVFCFTIAFILSIKEDTYLLDQIRTEKTIGISTSN